MARDKAPEAVAMGKKIKAKREKAGLTQQELANRLALHVRHIQRMEAGGSDIPLSRLCQLALALKTDLWVLMFGVEDSAIMPAPIPDSPRKRKPSLRVEVEKKPSLALELLRHQTARKQWVEKGWTEK